MAQSLDVLKASLRFLTSRNSINQILHSTWNASELAEIAWAKTLFLALFWVNRGDILGNGVFDFDLMHRKSSCLFIISLECFCLWIWNIKMAIVQANELRKKKSMPLLNKTLNYVQVLGFTFVEHLEGEMEHA